MRDSPSPICRETSSADSRNFVQPYILRTWEYVTTFRVSSISLPSQAAIVEGKSGSHEASGRVKFFRVRFQGLEFSGCRMVKSWVFASQVTRALSVTGSAYCGLAYWWLVVKNNGIDPPT